MHANLQEAAVKPYSDAIAAGDLVGAVLFVSRSGEVLLHEAVGQRNRALDLPMERNTPFQIASLTKPITATVALRLIARGLLDLDDRVSRYLPAFERDRCREITVRHLLTHTSGFRIETAFVSNQVADTSTLQREVARLADVGPAFPPGTTYAYSNPGYNTLGAVLEVAAGKMLEQLFLQEVLAPLEMDASCCDYAWPSPEALPPVYERRNGLWEVIPIKPYPFARGAGGLVSTASDYARFCQMYVDRGRVANRDFLSPELLEEATRLQVRTPYSYPSPEQMQLRGLVPRWYYERDARGAGIDIGYGLGWVIGNDGTYHHAGMWETFALIEPEREIVLLLLTQNVGGRNPGLPCVDRVLEILP